MNCASQEQRILAYLRSGHSLTPIQALRKFGCFRLGARIYDLRRHGCRIKRQMVQRQGKRFARYQMA